MTELLSDRLKSIRDVFKPHVHGGKRFSSDEIIGLVDRLDELVGQARDQELQLLVQSGPWSGLNPPTTNCRCVVTKLNRLPDNVIAFPRSRLPRHPSGGGDAA